MRYPIIGAFLLGISLAAPASANEALAKKSGCLTCHAVDAKKVGPSFKSTAAKYKGKEGMAEKLTAELSDEKVHPTNKATPAERKTLVEWVLAM